MIIVAVITLVIAAGIGWAICASIRTILPKMKSRRNT